MRRQAFLWLCSKLGRSGSCRFPSAFFLRESPKRRLSSGFGGEDHALSVFCGFVGPPCLEHSWQGVLGTLECSS